MSEFTPHIIFDEIDQFYKLRYKELCITKSLERQSKTGNKMGRKTRAALKKEYTFFNDLALQLDEYIVSFTTKNPDSVHSFFASLKVLNKKIEEIASNEKLQAVFEHINRIAIKQGATYWDFVDQETGEVLTELTAPENVPFVPLLNDEEYRVLFLVPIRNIREVLKEHLKALKQKTKNILSRANVLLENSELNLDKLTNEFIKSEKATKFTKPLTLKCADKKQMKARLSECFQNLTNEYNVKFIVLTHLKTFTSVFLSNENSKSKKKIKWAGTNAQLSVFLEEIKPHLIHKAFMYERASNYFWKYNKVTKVAAPFNKDSIRNHKIKGEKKIIPLKSYIVNMVTKMFQD